MNAKKLSRRDRMRMAIEEERAAAIASNIGPHRLSELEYEIYLLIERRPRLADPEEFRSELRSATERTGGHEPTGTAGELEPPVSRRQVETALVILKEMGFIETIADVDAGDRLRLTPWGKAAAVRFRHSSWCELDDWERRGRRRGESRPKRSEILIDISPWDIGPSFDDLEIEYLGLPTRIDSALYWAGIKTVGQLSGVTPEELLEMKRIGPKSVPVIEAHLRTVALELARAETAGDNARPAPLPNRSASGP